jgi:hypothetical protein
MVREALLCPVLAMFLATSSFAAHPLITDDAGTQGKGKVQIEGNAEYSREEESSEGISTRETAGEIASIISVGLTDNTDLVFTAPYQWLRVEEDGTTIQRENGLSDFSLELKWRFFEKNGWGLALKPGISLPTGKEEEGLGTGKAGYSIFFISSRTMDPWAFHLNLGYFRHENTLDEREDIWHVSIASELEVAPGLKAVANLGQERNPENLSDTHPLFFLGGLIYSPKENLDLDLGAKIGLNESENDFSILAGITWRF